MTLKARADSYSKMLSYIADDIVLSFLYHCILRGLHVDDPSLLKFLPADDALATLKCARCSSHSAPGWPSSHLSALCYHSKGWSILALRAGLVYLSLRHQAEEEKKKQRFREGEPLNHIHARAGVGCILALSRKSDTGGSALRLWRWRDITRVARILSCGSS